jgi:hypothetical protein
MIHLFITCVPIPSNASIYAAGLLPLVTYDFVNIRAAMREGLVLDYLQDFNVNFDNLGYHSVYFLVN